MNQKTKSQVPHSRRPPASGRQPSRRLTPRLLESFADELRAYHQLFRRRFQRREQRAWSILYLCGQLSELERKTIEPIVLALRGSDHNAVRGLQQFIGQSPWPIEPLLQQHHALVAESLGDAQAVVIVDGSGFPKQGQHSAGVAHQYCGHLGKVANCQEGVFLVYASAHGHTFLDARLYVPLDWLAAEYAERWRRCGIPETLEFQTEPALGLNLLQTLVQQNGLPFRWVAADERFGRDPAFLDGISALGKWYLVAVPGDTRVWLRRPPLELPGRAPTGQRRTRTRLALHAPAPRPVSEIVAGLPRSAWKRYTIQEGSQGPVVAEFTFLRVTTVRATLPGPRVWLVVRRSLGAEPELKYHLSNAPLSIMPRDLARLSGWRWPIETTLKEGKGQVGMDHYETRT